MLLLDLIFFTNTQSPCNHNFVLLWDEFFVSCGVLLNLTDQIIRRYGWVYVAVVSYLPVICFGLLRSLSTFCRSDPLILRDAENL